MIIRRSILIISCFIAAACLTIGMGETFWWAGLVVSILFSISHFFKFARKIGWLPSVCLAGYMVAVTVGVLNNGQEIWLVVGTSVAMISWDLELFSRSLEGTLKNELSRRCEREHLKSLVIAVIIGQLLILPGFLFSIRAPFALMLPILAVGFLGLLFALRIIAKIKNPLA
jgi:hypothetical protein